MPDHLLQRIVPAYANNPTNGPSIFRFEALTNVPQLLNTSKSTNFFGYNIYNPNATTAFLKLFDSTGAPVIGTDEAKNTFMVPGLGSTVLIGTDLIAIYENGLWMAATTGYLTTDAVSPGVGLYVELWYRLINL